MKGLELSKQYFEVFGRQMLAAQFPETSRYLAVGLTGSGSECYGYDDELSKDHDFEPGFCIFLPGEDVVDRKEAFRLERAYAKLPKEFMGYKRQPVSPVGGNRLGVIRTADFFKEKAGFDITKPDEIDWFHIPVYALCEATNGEIFVDPYGEVTRIRELLSALPEDVRRKKLAGHLLLMAQAGQYNYPRIIKRKEKAAAQLAVYEFVKNAMEAVFLLNRKYMPYYKWSFRAMRDLPELSELEEPFYRLLVTDNEGLNPQKKYETIEEAAAQIIALLQEQELSKAVCGDLEKHAYSVNDSIADGQIRNLHILYAV